MLKYGKVLNVPVEAFPFIGCYHTFQEAVNFSESLVRADYANFSRTGTGNTHLWLKMFDAVCNCILFALLCSVPGDGFGYLVGGDGGHHRRQGRHGWRQHQLDVSTCFTLAVVKVSGSGSGSDIRIAPLLCGGGLMFG